jgi:type I restriction enzyme S subunit
MREKFKDWRLMKLGELVKPAYGFGLSKDKRIAGEYIVFGSNGEIGTHNKGFTKKPCIIIGRKGSIGEVNFSENSCCPIDTAYYIDEFPNELDPEYLFHFLKSFNLKKLNKAAAIPSLLRPDLEAVEIPLPKIEEQQQIVGRIKESLSRVDEIKHLREESRKEANSLEESIFGDFLEDAQRDGCEVVSLGDILTKSQYGTSAKATADGKGFPVLRMGNIKSGHFDFSDLKYMELSDAELEKYRLNVGDILINRTNSLELVGKSAVFQKDEGDWVFASYLVRLVVDSSKAIPEFVNASINSRIGRAYVYATARRAIGMVNINAKEIAKMPLPLPSLEKQAQIVSQIKEARIASQSLLQELDIKSIESLSNSILRKAFSGEL